MSPSRKTILVVAAHPDDEILGVGGTIARHHDAGDRVHILIVAAGAASRTADGDAANVSEEIAALQTAAGEAAAILGAEPPRFAGMPDNRLDGCDLLDVVKVIEAAAQEIRPKVVYTHHGGDLNVDHEVVHRAVLTAFRPQPGEQTRAIYTFETVSSTEWGSPALAAPFAPARYVDIAAALDRKRRALECYHMEMRPFPHARSVEAVEALARLRGAQVGLEAAEGFGVMRDLWI